MYTNIGLFRCRCMVYKNICQLVYRNIWLDMWCTHILMCHVHNYTTLPVYTNTEVWRDFLTYVMWFIRMCGVTYSYVWRDSIIYVACFIHMRHMTHARMTGMHSTNNNTSMYEKVYILLGLFWKKALFFFARSLLKLYFWRVYPVYTNNPSMYEKVYILLGLFWKKALFFFARSLLKLYFWRVYPVYTNNPSIDKYVLLGLFLHSISWGLFLKKTPIFWGLVRCTEITMTEMQWRTACIIHASWSS